MTVNGLNGIENLSSTLAQGLGLTNGALVRDIDSTTKAIAKKGARLLRNSSPTRTGDYSKGWTTSKVRGLWVIHNRDRYQLTHLLEKGHKKRNNEGNVQARVHIAPIEERLVNEYIQEIERILRG